MAPDEMTIRDFVADWMAASKAHDSAKVLGMMTDDVVFMVPGASFGKQEFAAMSKEMSNTRIEGDAEVVECEVWGNRAWCRTRLRVTVVPPNGKATQRSGFTLSVFRKENGRWLLARDANLLMPPGGG